jgi:hypothetical protein
MKKKVAQSVQLADDLGTLFRDLVGEAQDFDMKRLFKQLEADMMDIRHKLALAAKIVDNENR